jgi:hypothetical protein
MRIGAMPLSFTVYVNVLVRWTQVHAATWYRQPPRKLRGGMGGPRRQKFHTAKVASRQFGDELSN